MVPRYVFHHTLEAGYSAVTRDVRAVCFPAGLRVPEIRLMSRYFGLGTTAALGGYRYLTMSHTRPERGKEGDLAEGYGKGP